MKKLYLSVLSLLISAVCVSAQSFSVGGIKYSVIEAGNTVSVEGVAGSQPESLTIPSMVEYNGVEYGVTTIGVAAFYGCSKIKNLELPESLTKLSRYCCSSMGITSLKLPSKITEIPEESFSVCTNLKEVALPENLTSIGVGAFSDCSKLESIELPASLTSVGIAAFSNCTSLSDMNYLGTAITWMQIDFASEKSNPLYYAHTWKVKGQTPTAINVMPAVERLRPYTFVGCTSLISVEAREGISSIGHDCFNGCTALESIKLPTSMTEIGEFAFSGCDAMKKLNVESIDSYLRIKMEGIDSNPMTYGADLYAKQGLSYATIVEEVVFPEDLTEVPDYILSGCTSVKKVVLNEGITRIGLSAFKGCSVLNDITLPQNVANIDKQAFSGCVALEEISIPDGCTSIGTQAFENCSSLTSVSLPSNITEIPGYMFTGCKTLGAIEIPNKVSDIGQSAFLNCSSLKNVSFPSSLFRISTMAFASSGVTEAVIKSASFKMLGQQAFYECADLKSVTLPASTSNIGQEAFVGTSLETLTCEATGVPYANANMCSDSTYSTCKLYVPEEAIDDYKQSNVWSKFLSINKLQTTGINSVVDGNCKAVYYDIKGRMINPSELKNGSVYIKAEKGKTSKIVLP